MQDYTSRNIGGSNKKLPTRTKLGLSLVICSVLVLLFTAVNFLPFIRSFLLGTFGLSIYPILLVLAGFGCMLLFAKKRYVFPPKYTASIIGLFLVLLCILQLSLTNVADYSFADYITNTYNSKSSPSGVIIGTIVYGLSSIFNIIGAYIVFAIVALVLVACVIDQFIKVKDYQSLNSRTMSFPLTETPSSRVKTPVSTVAEEKSPEPMPNIVEKEKLVTEPSPKTQALTLNAKLEALQKARDEKIANDPLNIAARYSKSKGADQGNDEMARKIFGDEFINSVRNSSRSNKSSNSLKQTSSATLSELMNYNKNNNLSTSDLFTSSNNRPKPFFHEENNELKSKDFGTSSINSQATKPVFNYSDTQDTVYDVNNIGYYSKPTEEHQDTKLTATPIPITPYKDIPQDGHLTSNNKISDDLDLADVIMPNKEEDQFNVPPINSVNLNVNKPSQHKEQLQMQQTMPTPNKVTKYTKPSPYVRPPMDLLTTKSVKLASDTEDYQKKAEILEASLESFRIPAKVVAITHGPAVTRYEIQMPAGISVNKITNHANDIAMNLSANGDVRIEAPIPGKNLVGIEVPNEQIATIGLRDVLDTPEFHENKAPLTFALGKDIAGAIKVCDLASMPHLLVAGSSGSGKSVCLNVLLISLLYKLGPEDLKLILIDPKRVEFTSYNGLPQLLTPTAINQPKQALNALDWAIMEMDNRYSLFQKMRVRDFKEYNSLEVVYKGKEPKLPRIVIVIDELADLMMLAKKDLEDKIMRLAQLARAAGIHLIIATQRPSVDVITGTIKANLPSRIAFAVTNFADSKTILDQGGADKLLGKGDMLYAPQNLPEPVRIQCPFVSNTEVINIVEFIKSHNESQFDDELTKQILSGKQQNNSGGIGDNDDGANEFDPLLPAALKDFMIAKTGSISAIQRRHSIGFNRAARIVDQMEKAGFISPADGTNKNRTVLITEEQYNELFGND